MEDLPKQAVKEQQKDETALVLGTLLKEGDTLTKSHLADVIYEQFGLPKRFCKEIVDLFFDEALECLVRGEELKLPLRCFPSSRKASVRDVILSPANPPLLRPAR